LGGPAAFLAAMEAMRGLKVFDTAMGMGWNTLASA